MYLQVINICRWVSVPRRRAAEQLDALLGELGLKSLQERFFTDLEHSSSPSVPAA